MTAQAIHPADVRQVPDWELCDRMRRALRCVRGMNNIDMAEALGVQRATVSTWLHGRRTPPRTTLMIWADLTGVDREWLITGEPSKEWYAIRDSNPEPADWEPAPRSGGAERPRLRLLGGGRADRPVTVKPRLTLVRSVAS